jgi:hypothetical protein
MMSLLAAGCVAPALAQDSSVATGKFDGASAGYSWFAPRGTHWGLITKRRFYLVDLAREWRWGGAGPVRFAGTLALPLAAVQRTTASANECWSWRGQPACTRDSSAQLAFGLGVSPGFKMYLSSNRHVRPYLSGAVGTLIFGQDVPVNGAGRLSWTIEYGGGITFGTRSGNAVTIGYKFHHLSNGTQHGGQNANYPEAGQPAGQRERLFARPRSNPGLDANVIYVGMLRRRI